MSRLSLVALTVGLLAALGCGLWALVEPTRAAFSWLVAWTWALNIALGCLVLGMLAHVAPMRWFAGIRRPLTAVAATLPLLALLFVPIVVALPELYTWTGPPSAAYPEHIRHMLERKQPWLNAPFWIGRSAGYLVLWSALAWAMRWLELREDDRSVRHLQVLSCAGLALLAPTWTAAAVDWWMSLEPVWTSTLFGIWTFAGGMVGALSVSVILARALERAGDLPPVPPDVYHALGRLLLAFVVFWTYTTYDQLMLQWIANLPLEVGFWVPRLEGGWYAVLWVLGLGHFALPFAVLLSHGLKRRPRVMVALAAWLLAMRLLDTAYLVLPVIEPTGPRLHLLDPLAVLAVGGLVLAWAAALADARVPASFTRWTLEYRSP